MVPGPRFSTVTGASNVTGWMPPIKEICDAARARRVPVVLDGAQLAPHRPLPLGPDYVAFSGHKLYAPFGAGALIGPRATFATGDPFLAGGGAVDLVDLNEVLWSDPPEREEAGSPNVIGAIAMAAALREIDRIGWPAIEQHERSLAGRLRSGLAAIEGVRAARATARRRDPRRGDVHHRRDAPRARRSTAGRRVGHRCSARLLLRAPLPLAITRRQRLRAGGGQGTGDRARPA